MQIFSAQKENLQQVIVFELNSLECDGQNMLDIWIK